MVLKVWEVSEFIFPKYTQYIYHIKMHIIHVFVFTNICLYKLVGAEFLSCKAMKILYYHVTRDYIY